MSILKNPKSKPRHEKVDAELFCKKKEEDYVDVKKDWQPLHSGIVLFFTLHISHDSTALPFCKFRIRSGKNRLRTRQYIFSFAAFYWPLAESILQEMTWWSIPAYFKAHASEEAKRKYKNTAQKKKYITETLGMELQFDRGCKRWMCYCVTMLLIWPSKYGPNSLI